MEVNLIMGNKFLRDIQDGGLEGKVVQIGLCLPVLFAYGTGEEVDNLLLVLVLYIIINDC